MLAWKQVGLLLLQISILKFHLNPMRNWSGYLSPDILENLVIPESIRPNVTRFYFDSTFRNQSMITSFAGAKSLLQRIKKSCKSVFLSTSRSRASTERFLSDFQLKFDCIVVGDDLERGKPDLMPGQLALSKLGLQSNEVVYIGDAQSDFQFAEALG